MVYGSFDPPLMLRTISTTSSRISGSPPETCTTHGRSASM